MTKAFLCCKLKANFERQVKTMQITMKAARVNAKLTQKEVAEKLGVSRVTIIHWEKGTTFPKSNQKKILSKLYNLSEADFF